MLELILVCLAGIITIIWSIIFVPFALFGFKLYKINDNKINNLTNDILLVSMYDNDEPNGWIIGKWFICYIHIIISDHKNTKNMYILIRENQYKSIIKKIDITSTEKYIDIYDRNGCYFDINYQKRCIKISNKEPKNEQLEIINNIINGYKKYNNYIVLIYGKPGSGKSWVPLFLANNMLNEFKIVNYVKSFNPSHPGDHFSQLYNKINPTENSPLIVLLDEVDIIIKDFHENKIIRHRDIPIQVSNKIGWNSFLDDFDQSFYPHVILIMTSNQHIDYFDNLDKSYMRKGRVHEIYNLQ
jgi:Cdc6-like AAA superfamily ATPase